MNQRQHAETIMRDTIKAVLPDNAVKKALLELKTGKKLIMIAIGKAAFPMGKAARDVLGEKITKGIILTKYGHANGSLPGTDIYEAGHPIADENSVLAAGRILDAVSGLEQDEEILLLLSGGASALFEIPEEGVSLSDIADITEKLLFRAADINEINTVRKRLSAVKGGKFALMAKNNKIYTLILSDVIGDKIDTIGSGIACADSSSFTDALAITKKYKLKLSKPVKKVLEKETPKTVTNSEAFIIGNVGHACRAAALSAERLGYKAYVITEELKGEARIEAQKLKLMLDGIKNGLFYQRPCAIIMGGETVVSVKGRGKGGRSQEFALAAAEFLDGDGDTAIFSFGTDGTDGPTDAAGGYADGGTKALIDSKSMDLRRYLDDNNSYNALRASNGLLFTGPTGTNVNDIAVMLCK